MGQAKQQATNHVLLKPAYLIYSVYIYILNLFILIRSHIKYFVDLFDETFQTIYRQRLQERGVKKNQKIMMNKIFKIR